MTSWGVVSTIKAASEDILNFVAYHLDLGATHLWVYLDDDAPEAMASLKSHPQVSVTRTRRAYWLDGLGKRPPMHQHRQTYNAEHAYARAEGVVDWLFHCDVDEFLWPHKPIDTTLAALPADCLVARVRPSEALSTEGLSDADPSLVWFKAFIPSWKQRREIVAEIYPTFGDFIKGGFLSHVAGKIFIRTGQPDLHIRIHNAMQDGEKNPGQVEYDAADLLHIHSTGWAHWSKTFAYRHRKGSYRADLGAARSVEEGGMNLHQLFDVLNQEPDGLRSFYEEVCLATPDLRKKLEAHGMLRSHRLDLAAKRQKHFPNFS
ncbi:MAG: glycosyltransferase family 2 protein [Shimia sp.]|uniref:glycosyltransferase family 2 protein n=1 Tax=Shimia sp. TaxID=1954381 RepID=UPI00405A2E5E